MSALSFGVARPASRIQSGVVVWNIVLFLCFFSASCESTTPTESAAVYAFDPRVCSVCHGSNDNPAPPRSTRGETSTDTRAVGAHQSHVRAGRLTNGFNCSECHVVPFLPTDPGHIDADRPADLTFGKLAKTDGAEPAWDGLTCSNVYCHGATLAGGTNKDPSWTTVDGTQAACGTCHGAPPPLPHPGRSDCESCHDQVVDKNKNIIDRTLHINGHVEVTGTLQCNSCHGSASSDAPPSDVSGNLPTSSRGVGAHQSHLTASDLHAAVSCSACHAVPITVNDAGHIDSALPAEINFGLLGRTGGASPDWNGTTCSNTYCHGATLRGGTTTSPTWTRVDGSQTACGNCHGIPPVGGGHPAVSGDNCGPCHPFTGLKPDDPSTHINGVVDGGGGPCGSCHGIPPATGAHAAHYADATTPPLVSYGDVRVAEDFYPAGAPAYLFGCGQCHPRDSALHGDGTVQVELYDPSAPASNLKARNPLIAAYDGSKCTNVYCHSSGQETPTFVASPAWVGGTIPAGACDACHGNPPRYASGGAGTSTANTHLVMADDGWELGHFGGLPGPWHASYHGMGSWGVGAAPITCQTCHYQTVDATHTGPGGFYYLDTSGNYQLPGGSLGYSCTSCHNGAVGAPSAQGGKADPTKHVNGKRDVNFDPRLTVPGLPGYPYWVTASPSTLPPDSRKDGATWSLHLGNAAYDPATKSCTNVACHLKQSFGGPFDPLVWGRTPVGNSTCNDCHQM